MFTAILFATLAAAESDVLQIDVVATEAGFDGMYYRYGQESPSSRTASSTP
jgi:hypothetical protein